MAQKRIWPRTKHCGSLTVVEKRRKSLETQKE